MVLYDEQTLFPFFFCMKTIKTKKVFQNPKKKIVPVNLKKTDAFHITIEEYLQALITLVEELVRPLLSSPKTHEA